MELAVMVLLLILGVPMLIVSAIILALMVLEHMYYDCYGYQRRD